MFPNLTCKAECRIGARWETANLDLAITILISLSDVADGQARDTFSSGGMRGAT
jgi:hypothetical protein